MTNDTFVTYLLPFSIYMISDNIICFAIYHNIISNLLVML